MIGFNEELISKWKPVLEHGDLPRITDAHRRNVTATLLENTEKAIREAGGGFGQQSLLEVATNSVGASGYTGNGSTGVAGYDPILISLIRRAMPNLVAYDVCGVQPMTGPTGLIFAMRANYANSSARGTEALYDEANTMKSTDQFAGVGTAGIGGNNVGTSPTGSASTYNFKGGMGTNVSEALGVAAESFPEMAFSIDKVTVSAKSRALKAEYTMELAQDLKGVHGLDAETELANILQTEILAEINREVVRTINVTATIGGTSLTDGTTADGAGGPRIAAQFPSTTRASPAAVCRVVDGRTPHQPVARWPARCGPTPAAGPPARSGWRCAAVRSGGHAAGTGSVSAQPEQQRSP